jgi:hypothetical protein
VIRRPDVLIVEGLNVLQPARVRADGKQGIAVSDFFDFSIYVDARTEQVRKWYVHRFLRLRETAFTRPESYFHRYALLSDGEAVATAERIWREINEINLVRERPADPRPGDAGADQGRRTTRSAGFDCASSDPGSRRSPVPPVPRVPPVPPFAG